VLFLIIGREFDLKYNISGLFNDGIECYEKSKNRFFLFFVHGSEPVA
jgi:hypothetical protein